jgi:hypothetical protein
MMGTGGYISSYFMQLLGGLKGAIGLGLSRRQSADIVNDFTNGSQVILRLLASEDGGVCWQI